MYHRVTKKLTVLRLSHWSRCLLQLRFYILIFFHWQTLIKLSHPRLIFHQLTLFCPMLLQLLGFHMFSSWLFILFYGKSVRCRATVADLVVIATFRQSSSVQCSFRGVRSELSLTEYIICSSCGLVDIASEIKTNK